MHQSQASPVAKRVVAKCGGARRVSEITGRAIVTVHKWSLPRERGGTGGLIPTDMQVKLMDAALRGEVDLTPADFFDMPEAGR
jgi:hypothetical protein